ncbi:MAG: hypothetical protein HY017_28700 [Betaproteobacteria bacterium]|nr:hypothetical protein [Betaproteobacteria bacterium]
MNVGVETSQRRADYEVLSPWADADPVPLRGIATRPADVSGRKIGLFSNRKRAAELTLSAFERQLLEKYPAAQTSWYACSTINTPEMLTEGKAKFEAWVAGVDAVVLSVAD